MARLGQIAAGGRCGDGFGAGAGFFLDCRLNSAKGDEGLGRTRREYAPSLRLGRAAGGKTQRHARLIAFVHDHQQTRIAYFL
jgi:hypothetical protein